MFAGVLLLSACASHLHMIKLDYVDQFIMAYGGLRGAMTFALVVLLDENIYTQRRLMITTAIVVVYVTNFLLVLVAAFPSFSCFFTIIILIEKVQDIYESYTDID